VRVRFAPGRRWCSRYTWTKLEDFLILGTTGGTYYLGEDRLTADNAEVVFQAVREDGPRVVAPVASRAWRSGLAGWFLTADVNAVAWKACKARQRKTPAGEALALRDILRIAHLKIREF
jgi:hypothetical protein